MMELLRVTGSLLIPVLLAIVACTAPTPRPTPTPTPTATPTGTQLPTATHTPSPTASPSPTPTPTLNEVIALTADFETDPVDASSADDPAFWQHPTDPSQSLILGTGKGRNATGNLVSYNLDGSTHQDITTFKINNVDVRGNTVCFGTREDRNITCLTMNPETRLMDAGAPSVIPATSAIGLAYGLCMYESASGLYGFVTDQDGDVEQYDLNSQALVRSFDVGTQAEGCVTDDEAGTLFIGEEECSYLGLWR